MSLRGALSIRRVSALASAVLITAAFSTTPAVAQRSLVTDWSSHHLKFTSPGSESDALRNGNHDDWQNVQINPRFQMQQFRRSAAYANRFANSNVRGLYSDSDLGNASTNGDWTSKIATAGFGTPQGMYPAMYTADFTTPSCTADFILFGVNGTGATTQPSVVGLTNLYKGTCSGTTPTVKYAYYVRGGTVTTSPALSLDGTQIAFVANVNAHAYFFVVTPSKTGTTGTVARPTRLRTTSGTGYTVFELDHGEADARSSPYVDFTNNNAYIGDSGGYVHKIQNVFGTTTPSEVKTGGWPSRPSGNTIILTGAIYDSATTNVFVGGSNGILYCITGTGTSCGNFTVATATGLTGGTAGPVIDAPIVVDTASSGFAGSIFALANYTTANSTTGTGTTHGKSVASVVGVLAEAGFTAPAIGTVIGVNVGGVTVTSTGTSGRTPPSLTVPASTLYDGDFDNEFYNSTPNNFGGNMYVCGNVVNTNVSFNTNNATTYHTTPLLYQVGIAPGGAFSGIVNTGIPLALNNNTTQASGCGSTTEFFNPSANSNAGADYLFLSVTGYGAPTSCAGDGCIMSFELPTSGPPPILSTAAYSLGGNGDGASGIVIDNGSTEAGASQIYFSNLQTGNATQASQAALQ